jgi:hypothetical protein
MSDKKRKRKGKRLAVSSGSPYEPIIGFSRAVRVGNIIAVGGTAAGSGGKAVVIGDATRACLEIIAKALEEVRCPPQGCDAQADLSNQYCRLGSSWPRARRIFRGY